MKMEFSKYENLAARTANMDTDRILERLQNRPALIELDNFAMGLAGEAGEVADLIKKVIFHGHELDKEKLEKELGDVLWYLSQVARSAGLGLEKVADTNVRKLMKRYPNGFNEKASINRVIRD
jgi:NTP pyrophosphatase (non-canonical NTP hydrolase)